MLTPKDIQKQTFARAVFGGYDMQAVDAFLEPLAQDLEKLYDENAVLKKKLRVLVQKLEEYRDRELHLEERLAKLDSSEEALEQTRRQCEQMLQDARDQASSAQDARILQEQQRLQYARQTAQSFIKAVEDDIRGHMELLEKLKTLDLEQDKKKNAKKIFDYDTDAHQNPEKTRAFVSQLEESLAQQGVDVNADLPDFLQSEPKDEPAPADKFGDLQFGSKYNPTKA